MNKPIEMVLIGAGQRGAHAYANYAFQHPEEVRFVAVAEPDPVRRKQFAEEHDLDDSQCFESWEALIEAGQLGRAAIVATQDQMHVEPAVAAMEAGYDVLLEKPMAHTLEGAIKLVQTAERTGRVLEICHVLRYSPFWTTLHEVVTSGKLGDIITVEHRENVSYWHMSHSFVRGHWRNEGLSSPMILAKCCHDLDILYWNMGVKTAKLNSFGSLIHYRPENAPPGAPLRCTDGCPVEKECPFSAIGIYLEGRPFRQWMEEAIETRGLDPERPMMWPFLVLTPDPTLENRRKALETGPYGRCVYHCDNDVVDNQVVAMELEDGRTVTLVMHGHSYEEGRTMRYDGTKATLRARFPILGSKEEISIQYHNSGEVEVVPIPVAPRGAGHGGGDFGIMADFLAVLRGEKEPLTTARESLESHLLAFAAETSRHQRQVIDMDEFRARAEKLTV
jgi:predicted dehydrogenase